MVAGLREANEPVENRLGSLDRRLVAVQEDLVPPYDHLALHESLDPSQHRVPVTEDLQHSPRRHDQLSFYLIARSNVRVSSSV